MALPASYLAATRRQRSVASVISSTATSLSMILAFWSLLSVQTFTPLAYS